MKSLHIIILIPNNSNNIIRTTAHEGDKGSTGHDAAVVAGQ